MTYPRNCFFVRIFLVAAMLVMYSCPAFAEPETDAALGMSPNSELTVPVDKLPNALDVEKDSLAQKALEKAKDEHIPKIDSEMTEAEKMAIECESGTPYNMKQAVEQALKANPGLSAYVAAAVGAEAGRKAALGNMLPSLSAGYAYTRYDHKKPNSDVSNGDLTYPANNTEATVTVHQDVFTGGNLWSTFQSARYTKHKSEQDLQYEELSMILDVQQNFLSLLEARENVRSAQDSVKRLSSQYKVTQAFYDVGLSPRLDVLQAEVDLATAEDTLLQNQNSVATQIAQLNTLLGLPIESKINYIGELKYVPFHMSLKECYERAHANRPDLKSAKLAVEIAKQDARASLSAIYPQLAAEWNWETNGDHILADGYVNHNYKTEFSSWAASLTASWKVFDWGNTLYTWRKAQAYVRQLQATEENTKNTIDYQIKSRHLKLAETTKRIKVNKKSVEAAEEGYRMAVARYQAQVGTNTDVLDAQSRLTDAEAGLTSAMADYQDALASLFAGMGMRNFSLLPN